VYCITGIVEAALVTSRSINGGLRNQCWVGLEERRMGISKIHPGTLPMQLVPVPGICMGGGQAPPTPAGGGFPPANQLR